MKTVATHRGRFHADDVTAVAILKLLWPDIKIIRTRDAERQAGADMRVDVGQMHDPSQGHFDHHQKGGALLYEDEQQYASAGLVWKEFGQAVTKQVLKDTLQFDAREDDIATIHTNLGQRFFKTIDMFDTGGCPDLPDDIITISDTIGYLNPARIPGRESSDEARDRQFERAVDLLREIIPQRIQNTYSWILAKEIIQEAFDESPESPIMVLHRSAPWKDHLFQLDTNRVKKLVIFESADGKWMVQTVPVTPTSFDSLMLMPLAWAGLSGQDLAEISGVEDAVFCHNARFIMAAISERGATELANKAIQDSDANDDDGSK
jgi:uncharacterized UPF0160 family protein